MTSVADIIGGTYAPGGQLTPTLDAAVDFLANRQTLTFVKYLRVVLPLDGFVFWVRADLLGAPALTNASVVSGAVPATPTFTAPGSLHRASDRQQREDETITISSLVFTSEVGVQPLNEVSPVVMFLATYEGVRFAFARRNSYYRQADLHHYVGEALYPALATQIIDDIAALTQTPVVSNSLPIWLSMRPGFSIFPSYSVPDNLPPPYAVVHIEPGTTRALQSTPIFDLAGDRYQLVAEQVRVTLYGLRNDDALGYVDLVGRYTLDHDDVMGIMNQPVFRDEKRPQAELPALAIKKVVDFEVNYYQARSVSIARDLIRSAVPSFVVDQSPRATPSMAPVDGLSGTPPYSAVDAAGVTITPGA